MQYHLRIFLLAKNYACDAIAFNCWQSAVSIQLRERERERETASLHQSLPFRASNLLLALSHKRPWNEFGPFWQSGDWLEMTQVYQSAVVQIALNLRGQR